MGAERSGRVTGGLRLRITVLATVVMAVVLGASAALAVVAQRRALTERVDEQLQQRADLVVRAVELDPGDLARESGDETFTQVVAAGGDVVAASANVAGEPPLGDAPPAGEREHIETVDGLPLGDDAFRVLSRRVTVGDDTFVVHVGEAFDDVEESVAVLMRTVLYVFPVVLVLVAGVIGMVVSTMLNRVDAAHRRQQQFIADASHELRTPLTTIRSELEVDLAHPETADLAGTRRSVLEETTRLQRLVDDLLALARSDDGAGAARRVPVDLDEIVLEEADALRGRGTAHVDSVGVSGAQVLGDADALARAVRNLLDNAGRHAASTVTVALAERGDEAVLAVADDGPGIPPEHAERVFERFTRVDEARARHDGGAGLGLAITRDIVSGHGGTISLDRSESGGATFVVRFPLARPR
ncbi:MAG TPA: ATP-binding protein [Acidimicrobiia bacterium]